MRPRRRSWKFLLPFLSLVAFSGAHAQVIGAISLRLGAEERTALKELSSRYVLSGAEHAYYTVKDTAQSSAMAGEFIGSVTIEKGRLVGVTREWPVPGDGPVAAVRHVIAVLRQLESDSGCRVRDVRADQPDVQAESLVVGCPGHNVEISVVKQASGREGWAVREGWYLPRER